MRDVILVVVAGTTETAAIDGISAAGADPELRVHTPSADLEIVETGRPAPGSPVPVSPSGCPTPAVVTRAVRELLGPKRLPVEFLDAGLGAPTAATVRDVGASPGGDLRDPEPVPAAGTVFERARALAPELAATADADGGTGGDGGGDEPAELLVAETIPGGTTTALGALTALGERAAVSSSLPANPIERKRRVVAEGLAASGLDPGDAAGDPIEAVRLAGDPVLAAVAGLIVGCVDASIDVTLAGGTQLAAAAALARHAGVERPLPLATTSLVAGDPTADLPALAADLDLTLAAADPGFAESDHPAMSAYARGEAKEGVGMGGALALAERAGVADAAVRDRIAAVTDRLLDERAEGDEDGASASGSAPTNGGDAG
ncbi:nicotinate-nucleotide--dimethylbenzimidazole phosphoribosyltransferase [Halorubrum sp. GN11_10-6_MGM]|uniref:nicotinate-nucleotide--dimethylbenzimidazole phosphoribosyltransferase n=1 Tax=Halorubrum sp. GN11_10-6_MGM TaxID=2518112 RepID=UPI0010F65B23|nr:nicotinate-nucleotide--dimethylbenzimidazole phosphoribosyltransferase [Halorubrum sp. GN11_10-6_MGM]TKX75646.1 nicotinate-nucleotide--dimethylbenzimidazole phosphoribosyltransferase [Halorubrum sp. GN11_10-6_MGM]